MAARERCSLRELARRLGVSDKVIRKAIGSGRLKRSVGYNDMGRPSIADVELAMREFRENAGRQSAWSAPESAPDPTPPPADVAAQSGVLIPATTLNEAQCQATNERARKLRLDNDVREGRLVEVAKAAKVAFEAERTIREAILNIPARLSAELAAESDAVRLHIRLDAALREALQASAGTIQRAVNE